MSNRSKTLLLIVVDALLLFMALTIVIAFRKAPYAGAAYFHDHYYIFSYIFSFWLLMYFIEGLYTLKTYNPANLFTSVIRGTALSAVVSVVGFYTLPLHLQKITPKTNLALIALLAVVFIYFWRKFFFSYFSKASRLRDTLLVGSVETLDLVTAEIGRKPYLGYRVTDAISPGALAGYRLPQDLELIAVERKMVKNEELYQRIFSLLGSGVEIMDLAKFAEKISGKIPIQAIDQSWFIEYCGHQESRSYDIIKGIIDRTIAIILVLCLVPVAAILLPVLLFVHGRPIFFTQTRTGLNNKPFTLYKLRTMVVDAEKNGAQWAKPGDARITPLGKFLRKSRLDELPQLLNILKGDMSLVGPRPERPEIIEKQLSPNIPYYNLRHLVKPGVTGWAQVSFRYGFSEEDSKEKLQFDLFYVKNRSLWLDLLVFLKTIKTVLTGAGQ